MIIEPCCYITQLDGLLASIEKVSNPSLNPDDERKEFGKSEVAHFFTNGDFSLPEFMDYFIGRSPGCNVFLSLVNVEMATLHSIVKMINWKDCFGNFMVRSFTLLSQGKERVEVINLLSEYRSSGRLVICEDRESFRCLAVSNGKRHYVLNGSINQSPVFCMQMFTLTTSKQLYDEAMDILGRKKRMKQISK